MQEVIVEFRDGWAWCPICVGTKVNLDALVKAAIGHDAMCEHSTIIHGMRFYTPQAINGKFLTAYEWYERELALETASGGRGSAPGRPASSPPLLRVPFDEVADRPDGVYVLTPSGEHALKPILDALTAPPILDSPDADRYQA